jgi:Ca-activated chloride channel family protein
MAGGDKIGFVRQGLTRLVNELDDDDRLSIVAYDTTAVVRLPLTVVGDDRNGILDVVQTLRPEGSTNIFDGLDTAFAQVLGGFDIERQHRVVLISDGVATAGNTNTAAIIAMAGGYVDEGVPLTTIGVGVDFDLQLMRTLAERGNGNFYFLDDGTAVDEVFTEEVATFLVPVAYDLTLDLELGSEWTIRNVYGVRDFVVDAGGAGGQVTIPAVFLAGRTSADDVFQGSGRRGGGSALLVEVMPAVLEDTDGQSHVSDVQVMFRSPGASAPSVQVTTSEYAASATSVAATGHFDNRIVEKSFVMLNILIGMRAASQAFYADAGGEAVDVIDGIIAAASDYEDSANAGDGDADIAADIAVLVQFRQVLRDNGAPNGSATELDDPWPAD